MTARCPAGDGPLPSRQDDADSDRKQAGQPAAGGGESFPNPPDDALSGDALTGDAPLAWPEEWDAWRLADAVLEAAYEATPPEERARIKSTLALAQAVYREQPAAVAERVVPAGSGYGYTRRALPAPWALLLLGPGAPSPVRVAAAIMPAHLAGVPLLAAMWTGSGRAPDALLAALELAGVEHVFAPPAPPSAHPLASAAASAGLESALAALNAWSGAATMPGRLLLLDAGPIPPERAYEAERAAAVPIWTERAYPRIASRLSLAPDLADLWLHPDLSPVFFLNTAMTLFPATQPIPRQ